MQKTMPDLRAMQRMITTTTRRTTMAKELTAADLAVYKVEITSPEGHQSRFIHAAYTTNEPGWLLLKDHQHRTVAQFNIGVVVMVERGDPVPADEVASDEDRIRDAMGEAQDHPGRVITR